jgi:DNA protecting protein DprA
VLRSELTELREAQSATTRELARETAERRALQARSTELEASLRQAREEIGRLRARVEAAEAELRAAKAQAAPAPAAPAAATPPSAPASTTPAAGPQPPLVVPAPPRLAPRPVPPPRPREAPGRTQTPEQTYAAALATFRTREHGQAVLDFLDFMAKYPGHPLVANAQYWIGEAYYVQRDYRQAMAEFLKVAKIAPASAKAADAYLKIGLCQRNLRDETQARQTWQRVVHEFPQSEAADLAARGVTIVSGLARGIDTAAHRGALEAGGRTLAVLGHGIAHVYPPENRPLAEAIVARGALLSQFPRTIGPLSHHFPLRNRTLAGLALGVVVVEAAERSGALITAGLAGELGREVFAVPGRITSPTSRGTHALIRDGARLVGHWSEIVAELGESWRRAIEETPAVGMHLTLPAAGSDEERMLGLLSVDEAQHIERLIARAGIDAARAGTALIALELAGWARQLAGQRWVATGARARRG